MPGLPALPPDDLPPESDPSRVVEGMQRHPSQNGPVPKPVLLPGNLPGTSLLLRPTRRSSSPPIPGAANFALTWPCPKCDGDVVHVHCGSAGCCALWCAKCDLVFRPDTGARIDRKTRTGASEEKVLEPPTDEHTRRVEIVCSGCGAHLVHNPAYPTATCPFCHYRSQWSE